MFGELMYIDEFQYKKFFSMGGVTEDFISNGRGGYFLDFVKYLEESGNYYHLTLWGRKVLIKPVKILNVDGQKILIVNEDSYVEEIEARKEDVAHTMTPMGKGGALINLPGKSDFKGLAIWNKTLPQDRFEEILTTFKFTN